MDLPLELPVLSAAYRDGLRPIELVREVLRRIEAHADPAVWISRISAAALERRAGELERAGPRGLPLFGVPFAINDNIDVAGLTTTAARNGALATHTGFVNLLDLAALAVPTSFRKDRLPLGVTLAASASDRRLLELGARLHGASGLCLGTSAPPVPTSAPLPLLSGGGETIAFAVCGAHLKGLPLDHELTGRGARLIGAERTAPCCRMFALPGGALTDPALLRADDGAAVEIELWEMPLLRLRQLRRRRSGALAHRGGADER